MDSFIVRIYRRAKEEQQNVTGLVEEVGTKFTRTFHNSDELVNILLREKKLSKPGNRRCKCATKTV